MFSFFKKEKIEDEIAKRKEFVVVDTELTGLDEKKDGILSIGAIRMEDKRILLGEVFYRLLNPQCEAQKSTVLVHGITASEIKNSPHVCPILKEFLDFAGNRTVVGHFVEIDIRFLRKEIKKWLKIYFNPTAIDTYIIFNWLVERGIIPKKYKGIKSLPDIAEAFNIKVERLHDALYDSFVTAQIFQRQISLIQPLNLRWHDFLKKIGSPHVSGYMFGHHERTYQI